MINDLYMRENNQLNWISLYLLNKLGNPNLFINDIEKVNKILEINNFNEENIKQIKKLGDQMSKKFNKVKQLIKNFTLKIMIY